MQKRCNKFKPLFIFRSEEEFFEHLDHCACCQRKFDEMMQVQELVRSAKPLYVQQKSFKNIVIRYKYKIAASMILLFLAFIGINNFIQTSYINVEKDLEIAEATNGSIFNQMNLPTDEYGILSIDKDFVYEN